MLKILVVIIYFAYGDENAFILRRHMLNYIKVTAQLPFKQVREKGKCKKDIHMHTYIYKHAYICIHMERNKCGKMLAINLEYTGILLIIICTILCFSMFLIFKIRLAKRHANKYMMQCCNRERLGCPKSGFCTWL